MNILQRINEVRKALSYVQKDQKKIDGQYTATRYDQVVERCHALMVAHGIIVATEVVGDWQVVNTDQKTSKGVPYTRYQGIFKTTFYNADDPKDFITASAPGFGLDQGDKGAGKAHTYATKSNLLKTLFLVTGDAEEERVETAGPKEPDEQQGMLDERLAEVIDEINKITELPALDKFYKAARKENGVKGNTADKKIIDAASKRKGVLTETSKDVPQ